MSFFNFLADFMDDLLDWKYSPVRAAILFLLFLLITVTVPISFYEATLPESELFLYPLLLKIFEYKFGEGGYYAVLNVVKTVITIIPILLVSQVEESVFRIRSVFGLSCDSTFRKVFSYAYLVLAILVAFSFVLYLLKKIFGNTFLGRAATRRLEKENEHSAQKEAKRQAKQRAAQAEIRAVKDAARQEMIEKTSIPHIEVDPDSYRRWKNNRYVLDAVRKWTSESYLNSPEGEYLRKMFADGYKKEKNSQHEIPPMSCSQTLICAIPVAFITWYISSHLTVGETLGYNLAGLSLVPGVILLFWFTSKTSVNAIAALAYIVSANWFAPLHPRVFLIAWWAVCGILVLIGIFYLRGTQKEREHDYIRKQEQGYDATDLAMKYYYDSVTDELRRSLRREGVSEAQTELAVGTFNRLTSGYLFRFVWYSIDNELPTPGQIRVTVKHQGVDD